MSLTNNFKGKIKVFLWLNRNNSTRGRLQEEGGRWSKTSTFCKLLYRTKCEQRGVGDQKKPNLVK